MPAERPAFEALYKKLLEAKLLLEGYSLTVEDVEEMKKGTGRWPLIPHRYSILSDALQLPQGRGGSKPMHFSVSAFHQEYKISG